MEGREVKKVTALIGSGRKGHTYDAARQFLADLEAFGDVETEIVLMSDYDIKPCRGCKVCFMKGEEFCPLKDDRDALIAKLDEADGLVFASPNYMFQASGLMKVFLDRLGFMGHRPRFHGKTFTSIVVQGIAKGGDIRKYLEFVGMVLGCNVVKGSVSTGFEPMTAEERAKRDAKLAKQAQRFHKQMLADPYPAPGYFMVLGFRFGRANVKYELTEKDKDFRYYSERGWLDSDFFYPTRLGPAKKALGAAVDFYTGRKAAKAAAARGMVAGGSAS
jgi:multimeric flavodoxin WrbA